MRFHIPNMSCGGCARGVTRAIESVDAKARITIDQASREGECTDPRRAGSPQGAAHVP